MFSVQSVPLLSGVLLGALTLAAQQKNLVIRVNSPPTHAQAEIRIHVICEGWQEPFDSLCTGSCVRAIDVPEITNCTVEAISEGLWGPRNYLAAVADSVEVVFDMLPAGIISGRLTTPRAVSMPAEMLVAFQLVTLPRPLGALHPPATNSSRCQVLADGAFSCMVPAGELDLKLRVPGFASRFFWGISVDSGHDLDLGRIEMTPGNSIAGWISSEDNLADLAKTEMVLRQPEPLGGIPEKNELRGTFFAQRRNPDRRGFFQFEGLAAGKYEITGSHKGYVSVSSPLLDLKDGVEAMLRAPMVLVRPIEVELVISPPQDARGDPWTVELFSKDQIGFSRDPESATADELGGRITIPQVAPGEYWLEVSDSKGNTWFGEQVSVQFGMGPIFVEADFVNVEGVVTLGEEPVEAWLQFSTQGRKVRIKSTREGRFEGVLPESGKWSVQVFLQHQQRIEILGGVEVPRPSSLGISTVNIKLPGSVVKGNVVTEKGGATGNASVFAEIDPTAAAGQRVSTQTITADNGSFHLAGVPAGRLTTYARKGDATSDSVLVILSDGLDTPPITLTLREEHVVIGTILGPAGPVPSAQVMIVPVFPSTIGVARVSPSLSGVDGRFEGRIPSWASHVDVAVFAPGYSAAFERFELQPDRELTITVDDRGGFLRVLWAAASSSDPNQGSSLRPRFFYGGVALIDSFLGSWAKFNTGGVWDPAAGKAVIPDLPAGNYSICWPAETGSPPQCSSGSLQPFGELTLELK